MRRAEAQENLLYITKKRIETLESNKIIAATAIWEYDTACITIYFDIEPSEKDLEDASDICTEIIAAMPWDSFMVEKFITIKPEDPLPTEFVAYRRPSA